MDRVKKFKRHKEDFNCLICNTKVTGTGYTDHCPGCLYSLHVDIFPGDRKSECNGLMEPISAFFEHGNWKIKYHCRKCGYMRQNKIAKEDNFEKIIELAGSSK